MIFCNIGFVKRNLDHIVAFIVRKNNKVSLIFLSKKTESDNRMLFWRFFYM